MSPDSPIFTQARELVGPLLQHAGVGDGLAAGTPDERAELEHRICLAEAKALLALCDEVLWTDYELRPALRDDFLGDELAKVARLVLKKDGEAVRAIRARVHQEMGRLGKARTDGGALESVAASEVERGALIERYLAALRAWAGQTQIPDALCKRVAETWVPWFGAAFRGIAGGKVVSDSPEDRRFEEVQRQSWRMDEVLAKIEKWALTNPEGARESSMATGSASTHGGRGPRGSWGMVITAAALGIALLVAALWVVSGASPSAQSLVGGIQTRRLTGLPLQIARIAAWMGDEPLPSTVIEGDRSVLQESGEDSAPISSGDLSRALVELQQKQVCRASVDGWTFHPTVRSKFRTQDAIGEDCWHRAVELLLRAMPESETMDDVDEWRALIPHLIELFESGKGNPALETAFPGLLDALARALTVSRVEPGRRPLPLVVNRESDALQKKISLFVDSATPYFEKEQKAFETRYGKVSREMVIVHRILAELSYRMGELKKEQDSYVRATRIIEKLEPRDVPQFVLLTQRLAISRVLAGNPEGGEEAIDEGVRVLRELHGDAHPDIAHLHRDMARIMADTGQFTVAWNHYKKASEVQQASYPGPTSGLAAVLEEQGQFLVEYAQYKPGVTVLESELSVWRQIEYPSSPNLINAYRGLGNAQSLAGDWSAAEKSQRTQVELSRKEFGPGTAPVRDAELELVGVLLDSGDPARAEEAKALIEPRIKSPLNAPIPDDAEEALVRSLYGRVLMRMGKPGEAAAQFSRTLDVLTRTNSRPSLAVANCLHEFGRALMETKREGEGVKRLAEAEAEFTSLSRVRPRYTRIASDRIENIRTLLAKPR